MKALAATMRTAFLEAWTNRRSFWLQVSFMLANDAALIVFWMLFFNRLGEVRGWDFGHLLVLFGVLSTVTGLAMGVLGNARRLGQVIADGGLDAALTLPVDPLGYLLVRQVDTALLGDLAFGPAMFAVSGHVTPASVLAYVLACGCGTVVFVSFLVILGSATLYAGGRGEQGDAGFHAVLMLASYPLDVFGGAVKLLLFTVLPAAFITGVPTELVTEFDWGRAGLMAGVSLFAIVAARAIFQGGLTRYRSGALWTRA
jgi:viologen exporter family transport system permease protein